MLCCIIKFPVSHSVSHMGSCLSFGHLVSMFIVGIIFFTISFIDILDCLAKEVKNIAVTGTDILLKSDEDPFFAEEPLFIKGKNQFYRIPTLVVTHDGTIIAAANARWNSINDFSPTTLVVRRRSYGERWEEQITIGGDEKNSCGIGSSVYDTVTGRVFIFGLPGAFISDDNGRTFKIQTVKVAPNKDHRRSGGTHGSGPGITIQEGEHAGRLLVPARYALRQETAEMQRSNKEFRQFLMKENWNCAIYSDDHGATWKTSEPLQIGTGEGTLVELDNGKIYYNSRAYFNDNKRRIATSDNGGESFSGFGEAADLIEPPHGCCAGLLRITRENGKRLLLYSGPRNKKSRTDLTVMASTDDGRSWRPVVNLTPGCSGSYSAMAWSEKEKKVCMLYETNKFQSNKEDGEIAFAEFNLAWIDRQLAGEKIVERNPIFPGADPEIRYFEKTGRYYIYPTTSGNGFKVFSSKDLVHWTDEGEIFSFKNLTWEKTNSWAPSILEKKTTNGYRYYFYFCANLKIGVAVANDPGGPFVDSGKPLINFNPNGVSGVAIDPNVFVDPVSGKTFLYWGNSYLAVCELADDLVSLRRETIQVLNVPRFFEGAFVFWHKGVYYLTWSENDTRSVDYRVLYATSDSPTGPFRLPENPVILSKRSELGIYGPGHHSLLQVPGSDRWIIAYHRLCLPLGKSVWARETCLDFLSFASDGSIIPVLPTRHGIEQSIPPKK